MNEKLLSKLVMGHSNGLLCLLALLMPLVVFKDLLNTIFAVLLDVFVVIYLDDILVYSQDEKEHVKHVSEVLQQLQKNGLYANGKKCLFYSNSVDYLRHLISPDGLKMDPDKVKVIQE